MKANEILKSLMRERDLSSRAMSTKIGRSPSYVSRMMSGGVTLGTATLAEIADSLGYDLVLRDRSTGTEMTIEPEN